MMTKDALVQLSPSSPEDKRWKARENPATLQGMTVLLREDYLLVSSLEVLFRMQPVIHIRVTFLWRCLSFPSSLHTCAPLQGTLRVQCSGVLCTGEEAGCGCVSA